MEKSTINEEQVAKKMWNERQRKYYQAHKKHIAEMRKKKRVDIEAQALVDFWVKEAKKNK